MVRYANEVVSYAPLYLHSFAFLRPHFLTDAEKFNIDSTDPTQMKFVADKLRYYRYKKGLLQKDVANYAGIERTTYTDYETAVRDYYPLDVLGRIAECLDVNIVDLLDEYNAFLYRGQAAQILQLRKQLGITQKVFALRMGVNIATYKDWEWGVTRLLKTRWEKMFSQEFV